MPRQKSLLTVIRDVVRAEVGNAIQQLLRGLGGGSAPRRRRRRGPGRPPGAKTRRRRRRAKATSTE